MTKNNSLGLCIMSWKGSQILSRTLASYAKVNLFNYFDDVIILFQEASDDDLALAKKYKLRHITTKENTGIENGVNLLLKNIETKYVVMLENDCPLIANQIEIKKQLESAQKDLENNIADLYRLRSIKDPGEKFDITDKYKKYHFLPGEKFNFCKLIRRFLRPGKYQRLIGAAIYFHKNSEKLHPEFISKTPEGNFIINSNVLNWTNQSIMIERNFMINIIMKYVKTHPSKRTVNGFQDIEKSLNCKWWRKQNFKIGATQGLFTHKRNNTKSNL